MHVTNFNYNILLYELRYKHVGITKTIQLLWMILYVHALLNLIIISCEWLK